MADDVNFCGKYLRLTAFLRVVQNELPQRPARFQQHERFFERLPGSQMRNHVTNHGSIRNCNSLQAPTTAYPSLNIGDAAGGEPVLNNEDLDNTTPAQPQSARKKHAIDQKLFSKTRHTSGNQKQHQCINGLALLRTTTLDGLPDPHDFVPVSAASITESDPIDEVEAAVSSQNTKIYTPIYDSHDSKNHRSDRKVPSNHESPLKPPRTFPIAPTRKMRSRQQNRNVQLDADGFVGEERTVVKKEQLRQRKKVAVQRPKQRKSIAELALASGPLPSPVLHSQVSLTSLALVNVSREEGNTGNLEHFLQRSRSQQRHGNETIIVERNKRKTKQRHRIIDNQLSKATAPVREDTDSNSPDSTVESENMTPERNILEDKENLIENAFPIWPNTPEFFEASSYFESAMQHLNEANRDSHDFWSQYNAME